MRHQMHQFYLLVLFLMHFQLFSSRSSIEVIPASLVLSSQFTGYDGREMDMDSNESVELTFPIKVRMRV